MIAVGYERVFAEQAKKRQDEGRERSHAARRGDLVPEALPEPNPKGNESAEQAGDLFNVSGRTVRDAQKAPQWPLDRFLSDFQPLPMPEYG